MGQKCVMLKDAVVAHLGSESVGRYGEFAIYHGFRNRLWTFVKNYPSPLFFVMAPLSLLVFLGLAFDKNRIGKTTPALKGLKDALKELRRVWRQRRKIQASRTAKFIPDIQINVLVYFNITQQRSRRPYRRKKVCKTRKPPKVGRLSVSPLSPSIFHSKVESCHLF